MAQTKKSKPKTTENDEYCILISSLADERKLLGLSQSSVANDLNITQSEISKIENLERRIDIVELKLLLRALRINDNNKIKHLATTFFGLEI